MSLISRIKKYHKIGSKLGAFTLALFLWLYIGLNKTFTWDTECRVVLQNIKTGKVMANRIPETVNINVTGKGIDLLWLKLFWKSDLKFVLDLSTINEFYDFPIYGDRYIGLVSLPMNFENSVTVNSVVSPDTIKVRLDELINRRVPISTKNISVTTKDGHVQVGEVMFKPDSVTVIGPRRYTSTISEIETENKAYRNKNKDFSEEIKLLTAENVNYSLSIDKVRFSVDIQKIAQNVIHNVPVSVVSKPRNMRVEIKPSTLNVNLKGGADYLKNLTADDITATVNYARNWRRRGEYVVEVNVTVPDLIIDYEVTPKNVKVEIK